MKSSRRIGVAATLIGFTTIAAAQTAGPPFQAWSGRAASISAHYTIEYAWEDRKLPESSFFLAKVAFDKDARPSAVLDMPAGSVAAPVAIGRRACPPLQKDSPDITHCYTIKVSGDVVELLSEPVLASTGKRALDAFRVKVKFSGSTCALVEMSGPDLPRGAKVRIDSSICMEAF